MPSGPIHKQNAVSAGRDGDGDLLEVERHGLGVAGWDDETGRLAERGTDGAENIGGGGSLILQGKRARAAFRPASRDLVFLTDAGFILEPEFEWLAAGRGDRRQDARGFFKCCDNRLVMRVVARPRQVVFDSPARAVRGSGSVW